MSKDIKLRDLRVEEVRMKLKNLQGRVLTIVDAVIENKNQNKATKDLINSEFNETNTFLYRTSRGLYDEPISDGKSCNN